MTTTLSRPRLRVDLSTIRAEVLERLRHLQDRDGPFGCFRMGTGKRPDLYSSIDVALMRAIMGEDLMTTVSAEHRRQWIEHINSFAVFNFNRSIDGSYDDRMGHGVLHANGQVIGALGLLGGRQAHPCRLYQGFDAPHKIGPWLETEVNWQVPWSESHRFWGGLHCYSFSQHCTEDWLTAAFDWLDVNADPATGWWRLGVEPIAPEQPLGGAVHILPLYEHHDRVFPYPERLVDSTLALQLPNGRWNPRTPQVMHYLELDALYALVLAQKWIPDYRRDDIRRQVGRYAEVAMNYYQHHKAELLASHPHWILAAVGTLGLLQRLLPEQFVDDVAWTDIFSDRRFYQTASVEVG